MMVTLQGDELWAVIRKAFCEKLGVTEDALGTITVRMPEDEHGNPRTVITAEVSSVAIREGQAKAQAYR